MPHGQRRRRECCAAEELPAFVPVHGFLAAEEPDTPPGEGRGRIPAWTVLGGPATALASAPRSHSCPQARAQASPQSVLSKQRKGRLLSWLVVTNRTCFESPRGVSWLKLCGS